MKKILNGMMMALTIMTLAAIALGVSGCMDNNASRSPSQNESGNKAVQYTCAMHPDVVTDEPGKCPKCGMDLVEKK